jgi:membrane protease YdiL (CAAX protease family)
MNNPLMFEKLKTALILYVQLWGLYLLFGLIVVLLKQLIPDLDLSKYAQENISELIKNNKAQAFLVIILIAPILEELMFRTLLKPSNSGLLLFLGSWTVVISGSLVPSDVPWYHRYVFIVIALILFYFLFKIMIKEIFLDKTRFFLLRHQSLVLQLTAVLFGFVHLFNYVDTLTMNNALFLLVVPRIIAGHIFGVAKIKNHDIAWPMLLHALNNSIPFIMMLLYERSQG